MWGSHCPAPTAPFSVGARSCFSPTLPAATFLAPPSASSFAFCPTCARCLCIPTLRAPPRSTCTMELSRVVV
eukprot:768999-Pyramimonas_sp.AAC.1